MPHPEVRLVLTCEHGGNRVPAAYRALFAGRSSLLESHRGWDEGALAAARALAARLHAPLIAARTTRLLIDLNRSPDHRAAFSEITRTLPPEARADLRRRYHEPHWNRVRAEIAAFPGTTLHLAVHSFTPRWRGERRRFSLGILYDPARPRERSLATDWQRRLAERLPRSQIRRNAPYRGVADGLTTALRRERPPSRYLGLELELNQQAIATPAAGRALAALVAETLGDTVRLC